MPLLAYNLRRGFIYIGKLCVLLLILPVFSIKWPVVFYAISFGLLSAVKRN